MPHITSTDPASAGFTGWAEIDTVLLDMDGTLLDLRFDNYFWLEVIPERFAQRHAMTLEQARAALLPRFAAKQGTLQWYCTDFWSRELELDIAGLKHELRSEMRFLPGAREFLEQLSRTRLRKVLVTNAHGDPLRLKAAATGLLQFLTEAISSHQYGVPKEHPEFWRKLQADLKFDPSRTLFVDDSLPVLRAAREHGIAYIIAIAQPDTTLARRETTEFANVAAVVDLLAMTELPRDGG